MSALLVQDYLQTQGLRLPTDEVRVALMTLQAVINMGEVSVDRNILWYCRDHVVLSDYVAENSDNEKLLKQIFMALDSVGSRCEGWQSIAVYALMPSENGQPFLLRLAQQGSVLEQKIEVNEESGRRYLSCRTAATGWLNVVNDMQKWFELGEVEGDHHRCLSQMVLPVCAESGKVLGVVQVDCAQKNAFDNAVQTDWVALAVALAEPMQALLGEGSEGECENE
ncbi:hypothetical protein PL75_04025 [Neisseria arctica]|uniref:GAF domain-containing protein n=1 Tax=Neisseria arctica TaxID=1470200 RepID=A0A0J0YTE5_9NEIS|nr:GAF domain-containing protein [Neisseria arctica]KLT73382.1 hypothetical protein PL75_04025 [Neisseria arctica]UOO87347.1 GAF domain-containing protein [Neisseria arctica]